MVPKKTACRDQTLWTYSIQTGWFSYAVSRVTKYRFILAPEAPRCKVPVGSSDLSFPAESCAPGGPFICTSTDAFRNHSGIVGFWWILELNRRAGYSSDALMSPDASTRAVRLRRGDDAQDQGFVATEAQHRWRWWRMGCLLWMHIRPSIHPSSIIIHHSSFIIHHSSSIIHHSPSIIHHSSFIIRHSPSIIHHSSFIIHHPSIHHSSSIMHHSSFVIHHPSFIIHHSSSIQQHPSTARFMNIYIWSMGIARSNMIQP